MRLQTYRVFQTFFLATQVSASKSCATQNIKNVTLPKLLIGVSLLGFTKFGVNFVILIHTQCKIVFVVVVRGVRYLMPDSALIKDKDNPLQK